jgi:hypothetical protein
MSQGSQGWTAASRIFAIVLGALALGCICAAPAVARSQCGSSHRAKRARRRAGSSRSHRGGGCLKASITVQGQPGAAGAPTTFALRLRPKAAKIRGYAVDYGDGSTSRGGRRLPKSITHVYRNAGRYTIALKVKGSHHTSAKARVSVAVLAAHPAGKAAAPSGSTAPGYDPALRNQLNSWLGERPAVGDNREAKNQLTENATLGSVPNLYPGSLVQGDAPDLTTGVLKPIPLQPNSGTLTLDGAHLAPASGGSVTRHVAPGNAANVANAVSDMQGQNFNPNSVESVATDFKIVTSSKEAKLDAKAAFSYAGIGKASGFFNEADSSTESHVLFSMREIYYTISYRPDPLPGSAFDDVDAFFAPGTTVQQAQECQCMSTEKPPAFVKSVTYGSQFLFMASSTADASDLKEGLEASVNVGAFGGSGSVSSRQKALLDQTEIQVLAVGGDTNGLASVISGSLGDGGKGVLEALKKYAQAAVADPNGAQLAQPIFYTLDYVDNTPIGEFAPNPPAATPPANSDVTNSLELTMNTTDENKDEGDPVRLSLTVPTSHGNLQVLNNVVPTYPVDPCGVTPFCYPLTNWELHENSSIKVVVPLPQSVPVYDIPGSTLTISDAGHSWHVGFKMAFKLPDTNYYTAFTSKPGMYYMDDNSDPCHIEQEVSAYTFTMYEVNDPAALDSSNLKACGSH